MTRADRSARLRVKRGPATPHSLTRRTVAGLSWSWLSIAVTAAMRLAYTAVISRLLDPADFGLVAGAMLGLGFVSYLARSGLSNAVVQKAEVTETDTAVALTLSVILGVAVMGLAMLLSQPLAGLVNESQVAPVMRWMALGVLLGSVGGVPEALLRRRMQFRRLALVQIVAFAVGYLVVGITMAVRGAGVWSLVGANLSQATVSLLLLLICSRIPLRLSLSRHARGHLISFGGTLAVTNVLEYITMNADSLAVARWIGPTGLGQYSRATYLVSLPLEQVTSATSRVLLPSLARVQGQPERFQRGFNAATSLFSVVVCVPVAVAGAGAPMFVRLLLGEGWNGAAQVLPITASAYGLSLLSGLIGMAAEARAVVVRRLLVQAVSLGVMAGLLVFVVNSGPTLIRVGSCWLASEVLRLVLFVSFVLPFIEVRRIVFLKRLAAALFVATVSCAPVFVLARIMGSVTLGGAAAGVGLSLAATCLVLALPTSEVLRQDATAVRRGFVTSS